MLPDKPTHLTANEFASRYLKISWKDPKNTGVTLGTNRLNPLTKVRLIVLKDTVVIFNKIWEETLIKRYKLENLIPYTTYVINVTAGNSEGFGGSITASFTTAEDDEFILFLCAFISVLFALMVYCRGRILRALIVCCKFLHAVRNKELFFEFF